MRGQRTDDRGQKEEKRVCQGRWMLERSLTVFAIAVGGYGQAKRMGPKMCHSAEKIHGFFRIFVL